MLKKAEEGRISRKIKMAPAPGLEPGTKWLTATYSTIELCRSVVTLLNISPKGHFVNSCQQKKTHFFRFIPLKTSKTVTSFPNLWRSAANNLSKNLSQAYLSMRFYRYVYQKD